MIVMEWNIDNFSCWNGDVHEKQIECPVESYSYCPRIVLYPRGTSGSEEHLVVLIYIHSKVSKLLPGQLTIKDSRGSPIFNQDIHEEQRKGDYYELLTKLKFKEVAAQITENENLYQDRLTLHCNVKWHIDITFRFHTTIDVCDSTIKISCITHDQKPQPDDLISTIQYPFDDCEQGVMQLNVVKCEDLFSIQPTDFQKNILVFTYLSVLKFDAITRTEKREHVFKDKVKWWFLNSLRKQEVTEEGYSLLLRVKIIPSNKYKHPCGYRALFPRVITALPTNIFQYYSYRKSVELTSPEKLPVEDLLKELFCLYKNYDIPDVKLRCEGVTIPIHKNIVRIGSTVLEAMLFSDTTTPDTLDITDLDVHTLGRFLIFLYTRTVGELEWDNALKLYCAAEKYRVRILMKKCSSILRENVSVANVCDILCLADKYQDDDLTTKAHDFVLRNYTAVLRSEGWKTFMSSEPLLAVKTVTNLAEKNVFRVVPNS